MGSYKDARGVLQGVVNPGDTPEAAIRRARGDTEAYEERIAALEAQNALLLRFARAQAAYESAPGDYPDDDLHALSARLTALAAARDVAWAALIDAGLLDDPEVERQEQGG